MLPRRLAACILALAIGTSGCVVGDADPGAYPSDPAVLAPTFEVTGTPIEVPPTPGPADPSSGPPSRPDTPTSTPAIASPSPLPVETPSPGREAGPTATSGLLTATMTDPSGDVTPRPLDAPPRYADLRGATLTRTPSGWELAIDLHGGVPDVSRDSNHTMNIAAFFELGGDSTIDYEVWVNLNQAGWGTAYFDNGSGTARYADEDRVDAVVDEGRLFVRFPLEHLASASTLRWSMASEWGRYEEIGSPTMARDYLPDSRDGRPFPE